MVVKPVGPTLRPAASCTVRTGAPDILRQQSAGSLRYRIRYATVLMTAGIVESRWASSSTR